MNFHSILAVTDLSPRGNRAVLRAAMLAAEQRALLKIIFAASNPDRSIGTDGEQDVKQLAAEMHTRFGVLVKIVANPGGHLQAVAEEARWADLLVIGEHRESCTRAFFCGQPIERLQRAVPCPLLLVRQEASDRYRRVLLASDFRSGAHKVLKLARWLGSDADIEPFQAPRTMLGRSDGARRAVIQQEQHAGVDLLVVGRRSRFGLFDRLFRSGAHNLLRWSHGDVLLVPHDSRIDTEREMAASPFGARPARSGRGV